MAIKSTKNKRRKNNSKYKVNLSIVIVIILVSILTGYMTTKYVIYPFVLGIEPENLDNMLNLPFGIGKTDDDEGELSSEHNSEKNNIDNIQTGIDDNDVKSIEQQNELSTNSYNSVDDSEVEYNLQQEKKGFCIQYGSFSTNEGAKTLQMQLKSTGVPSEIVEKNGTFKVIGQLFETKEEAAIEKEKIKGLYEDAFITSF